MEYADILERRKRQKTVSILCLFFVVIFFAPVPISKASSDNSGADITIKGVVRFSQEFSDAVKKNSKIQIDKKIVLAGDTLKVDLLFSNGEAQLKKEKYVCDFYDSSKQVLISYIIGNNKTNQNEFSLRISADMIGKNTVRCQIISYKEPIVISSEQSFYVFPNSGYSLQYLVK
jgi:hypothetical protein